jgi:hypothetical protein
MFKRLSVAGLFLLAILLTAAVAAAQDSPTAPTAVRVRVAHLAPFPGSDNANITVRINGTPRAANLAYGGRTDYVTLGGGAGNRVVEVVRNGTVLNTRTVMLEDGDSSIIVIGNEDEVAIGVLVVNDSQPEPGETETGLRVFHVAPIGATIDATRVDVCSQDGIIFNDLARGLRFGRNSPLAGYKPLPIGTYDLKVTRYVATTECAGTLLIDPPPLSLGAGVGTTLYLVGDGPNQPLAVFTFAAGLIGDGNPPPTGAKLFLPVAVSQN